MNVFEDFVRELQRQLSASLPGQQAQFEMASTDRKINPPDLSTLTGHRESAVCILLYYLNETVYFPLIGRVVYPGSVHSGQIALPGGKIEPGETSEAAALRELHEEIGYSSDKINVIGKLTDIYIPPSNFLVKPYVAYTAETPEFTINPGEVDQLILYKLTDLLQEGIRKETELEPRPGYKIKTPYFDVQGRILWGATAMMLNELRHLLKSNPFISSFQSP